MDLYKNCSIVTMNETMPKADYMVVEKGNIVEIGLGNSKRAETEYENVYELKGNTVIPGLWESHLHIIDGTRSILEMNLRTCCSFNAFKEKLMSYVENKETSNWVVGHGWDEVKIFEGIFPDRHLLDSLCSTHPIVIIRMDGHSLCTNTRAIEMLDMWNSEATPELPLGSDGRPTGMFYENTANAVLEKVRASTTDSQLENTVLKAQELFIKNGITSVNDICTKDGRLFDIYRRLQKEGRLKVRITAAPFGMEEESMHEFAERTGDETERLRIGPPKYFIDGSFGSRTALLCEDYADEAGNNGLRLIEEDHLKDTIINNEIHNMPMNIHAIGDLAVHSILDCHEAVRINNNADIRSRIEHVQIALKEDIERFKRLNITASFQPVFLYETDLTLSRLGKERLDRVYMFKSFMKAGVNVLFNSDWPYGGGDMPNKPAGDRYIGFEPLLGIHAACCKQMNEAEKVTSVEALAAYTRNPAYSNYRENELGRLKEGFAADFTVLSKDITSCNPEEIIHTEVLMTVIAGETVYTKE